MVCTWHPRPTMAAVLPPHGSGQILEATKISPGDSRKLVAVSINTAALMALYISQRINADEWSEGLNVGQLVKDEHHHLVETVSALEVRRFLLIALHPDLSDGMQIMDPKMDSGLISDEERSEAEYDILRNLSLPEAVGLLDQLLCLEVRKGHSKLSLSFPSPLL